MQVCSSEKEKNMLIINKDEELVNTEDAQLKALEACYQELKLWKGENLLDIESGVDYAAVFEQTIFLKPELERVCDKHAKNFRSIEIGEPEMSNDEIVRVKITFNLLDNTTQSRNLAVKASK